MKISDIAIFWFVNPYSLADKYQPCHDIYLLQTKSSLLLKPNHTTHHTLQQTIIFPLIVANICHTASISKQSLREVSQLRYSDSHKTQTRSQNFEKNSYARSKT